MSIAKRTKWLAYAALPTSALIVFFACTNTSTAGSPGKPKYSFMNGAGPNGALVVIDGKSYSEDDLMGDEKMEFIDAQKKIYELRMARVGRVLLQATYGETAKKENLSLEEYLDKKILKGDFKVSEAEFKKFVEERQIPKDQMNDQLKERVNSYLVAKKKNDQVQNLIAKLSNEKKVELYFSKPAAMKVEVGASPSYGKKDAKVTVVEFSDFQCPYCSKGADVVKEIKKHYGSKVQVAFRHFPLVQIHPQAKGASEASMCINEQSTDKFWKFHDKLFENQSALDGEALKKHAKDIGANVDEFNKCVDAKKFSKHVEEDMMYGEKLGIRSTPTFFVNGQLVQGALPFAEFKKMIDEAMAD